LSPTISFINKALIVVVNHEDFYKSIPIKEVVAHELGHGFGYRHTSTLPSVMKQGEAYGGLFSEHDKLHMKVMYSRPVGNFDIDNDPVSVAKTTVKPVGRQVFIDRWSTSPLSSKLRKKLHSLPGLAHRFLEEAGVVI
jgi:hypothetical protein